MKKNIFLFGSLGIFKISVNPLAGRNEGLGGETHVYIPESTEINTGEATDEANLFNTVGLSEPQMNLSSFFSKPGTFITAIQLNCRQFHLGFRCFTQVVASSHHSLKQR